MDPRILLIAAVGAGLWYGATKTVSGVKKMNHAIASKFHHKAATPQKADTPK